MKIRNVNKIFNDKFGPTYRIEEDHIYIFEDNYDLHCNFFKDSSDSYKKKKNVYIETTFIIDEKDRCCFGIRFVDDEVDELLIDLNSWSFDALK